MKNLKRRRAVLAAGVATAMAGALLAAGCAQGPAAEEVNLEDTYLPVVQTLDNGVTVQRTPSENLAPDETNSGIYHHPERAVPYNTFYLKADERGCGACHENLVDTVKTPEYDHPDISNNIGVELTVEQCIDCHVDGQLTNPGNLGVLLHGIHDNVEGATCWSCHYAGEQLVMYPENPDGTFTEEQQAAMDEFAAEPMKLWDEVKYRVLHGIMPVENVEGTFDYTFDKTVSQDQLPNLNWQNYANDYLRVEKTEQGAGPDEELFNQWTITITGLVQNEVTFNLKDLVENSELITRTVVYPCVENAVGGNLLGQAEVTGVPLKPLLDQAGLLPEAGSIMACSSDGFGAPFTFDKLEGEGPLLVTQINGEPLQWRNGYPVQLWVPGGNTNYFVKEVSDLVVDTADAEIFSLGIPYYNPGFTKPTIAFTNLLDGQVVKTGEPVAIEGYAYAFEDPVVAVEFSMDQGATWTTCPVEGATADRWTTWSFTFTPPADSAYVLQARCVTASGVVNEVPAVKMFNAKTA